MDITAFVVLSLISKYNHNDLFNKSSDYKASVTMQHQI